MDELARTMPVRPPMEKRNTNPMVHNSVGVM